MRKRTVVFIGHRACAALMVTYEALFAYTMVLIGIVSLVIQIIKK